MVLQRLVSLPTLLTVAAVGVASVAGCSSSDTDPDGSAGTNASDTGGSGGTAAGTTGGSGGDSTGGVGTGGTGTGGLPSGGTGGTTTDGEGGTGTGGTGGDVTGGAGGETSTGGAGGDGTVNGRPSGPSAGCMKQSEDEPGSLVAHMIDITGMDQQYVAGYTHRKYCTRIPANFDPTKAYPVVFYGPGCGATGCEGAGSFNGLQEDFFIVQAIAGADAKDENIVPHNGSPGCFQAGKEGTGDSPEGPYFDQVMAEVQENYCVDKGRVFAAGTSSGAWLSNYLACARGNVIRGTAADSGGLQFDHGTCTGGAGVMELPGDSANNQDQEGHDIGSAQARDMFVQLNGCSTTPTTMSFGPANNCEVYGGCASPVVWCDVGGGHQSGNNVLAATAWAFWSTLE